MLNNAYLKQLETIEIKKGWLSPNSNHIPIHFYEKVISAIGANEILLNLVNLQHFLTYNHIILLLSILYPLYLFLFCNIHYIRSDNRGITVHRTLSHRFIKWEHVEKVVAKQKTGDLFGGLLFFGKRDKIWLPLPYPRDRMESVLLGSIFLHLTQIGKADSFPHLEEIEDLWWQAPESLPAEIEWTNKHTPDWKIYYKLLFFKVAFWILIFAVGGITLGFDKIKTPIEIIVIILGALYAILWLFLRRTRTIAESACVKDDAIKVKTGFGYWTVPWSSITLSGWDTDGLILKAKYPNTIIRLPDQESASTLLLVVLKKLRSMEAHKWIAVPATLRSSSCSVK